MPNRGVIRSIGVSVGFKSTLGGRTVGTAVSLHGLPRQTTLACIGRWYHELLDKVLFLLREGFWPDHVDTHLLRSISSVYHISICYSTICVLRPRWVQYSKEGVWKGTAFR